MHSIWLALILIFGSSNQSYASLRTDKFNDNWAFYLGDCQDAEKAEFDDSKWKRLSLPHDWSISQPFDKDVAVGNDGGYLPAGIGWYRKTLNIPEGTLDRKRKLYFEGVYMDSEVYVNGKRAGGHPYGYSSFL